MIILYLEKLLKNVAVTFKYDLEKCKVSEWCRIVILYMGKYSKRVSVVSFKMIQKSFTVSEGCRMPILYLKHIQKSRRGIQLYSRRVSRCQRRVE